MDFWQNEMLKRTDYHPSHEYSTAFSFRYRTSSPTRLKFVSVISFLSVQPWQKPSESGRVFDWSALQGPVRWLSPASAVICHSKILPDLGGRFSFLISKIWEEDDLAGEDVTRRGKSRKADKNRKLCCELVTQEQQQQFSQANKIQKNFFNYQNYYYIFFKKSLSIFLFFSNLTIVQLFIG